MEDLALRVVIILGLLAVAFCGATIWMFAQVYSLAWVLFAPYSALAVVIILKARIDWPRKNR